MTEQSVCQLIWQNQTLILSMISVDFYFLVWQKKYIWQANNLVLQKIRIVQCAGCEVKYPIQASSDSGELFKPAA
jgi:hypothetical protein